MRFLHRRREELLDMIDPLIWLSFHPEGKWADELRRQAHELLVKNGRQTAGDRWEFRRKL